MRLKYEPASQMHTTSASTASTRRAHPAVDGSSPPCGSSPGAARGSSRQPQPEALPLDSGPPRDQSGPPPDASGPPPDQSGPPQEESSGPPRETSRDESGEARGSEPISRASSGPHATRRRSGGALVPKVAYRGTSLIKKRLALGPYGRPMPRALCRS